FRPYPRHHGTLRWDPFPGDIPRGGTRQTARGLASATQRNVPGHGASSAHHWRGGGGRGLCPRRRGLYCPHVRPRVGRCVTNTCFITSVHGGAFPLNMAPCHVHQLIAASRGIKPSRIQHHDSGEWVCEGPVSSRTARTASTYYSGPCISQG